jgi:ketosteroid isomerase-like protein
MRVDLHPFLSRLVAATNAHDLEALVDCFTPDYANEAPLHPSRGFSGSGQVRSNWEQIFAFVPDATATVLDQAVDGQRVWSEWEMRGTRLDGTLHLLRGVIVFELDGPRASSARFYLEPVDETVTSVAEAVQHQIRSAVTR